MIRPHRPDIETALLSPDGRRYVRRCAGGEDSFAGDIYSRSCAIAVERTTTSTTTGIGNKGCGYAGQRHPEDPVTLHSLPFARLMKAGLLSRETYGIYRDVMAREVLRSIQGGFGTLTMKLPSDLVTTNGRRGAKSQPVVPSVVLQECQAKWQEIGRSVFYTAKNSSNAGTTNISRKRKPLSKVEKAAEEAASQLSALFRDIVIEKGDHVHETLCQENPALALAVCLAAVTRLHAEIGKWMNALAAVDEEPVEDEGEGEATLGAVDEEPGKMSAKEQGEITAYIQEHYGHGDQMEDGTMTETNEDENGSKANATAGEDKEPVKTTRTVYSQKHPFLAWIAAFSDPKFQEMADQFDSCVLEALCKEQHRTSDDMTEAGEEQESREEKTQLKERCASLYSEILKILAFDIMGVCAEEDPVINSPANLEKYFLTVEGFGSASNDDTENAEATVRDQTFFPSAILGKHRSLGAGGEKTNTLRGVSPPVLILAGAAGSQTIAEDVRTIERLGAWAKVVVVPGSKDMDIVSPGAEGGDDNRDTGDKGGTSGTSGTRAQTEFFNQSRRREDALNVRHQLQEALSVSQNMPSEDDERGVEQGTFYPLRVVKTAPLSGATFSAEQREVVSAIVEELMEHDVRCLEDAYAETAAESGSKGPKTAGALLVCDLLSSSFGTGGAAASPKAPKDASKNTSTTSFADVLTTVEPLLSRSVVLVADCASLGTILSRSDREIENDPDGAAAELFRKIMGVNSLVLVTEHQKKQDQKGVKDANKQNKNGQKMADVLMTCFVSIILPPGHAILKRSDDLANQVGLKDISTSVRDHNLTRRLEIAEALSSNNFYGAEDSVVTSGVNNYTADPMFGVDASGADLDLRISSTVQLLPLSGGGKAPSATKILQVRLDFESTNITPTRNPPPAAHQAQRPPLLSFSGFRPTLSSAVAAGLGRVVSMNEMRLALAENLPRIVSEAMFFSISAATASQRSGETVLMHRRGMLLGLV
ncbi:unnamed protein product [Amoebophrya sp. A25]|nr:unnamed protein product [Amoebophrya sp. A25]|eukprot:GSA25T00008790001.1